ncbi:MAG: hypothetical protein GXP08_11315 [Gammaproteobacteria bacterium]|nr:hypothetical protein [Gammaproteobacteria bacterium]
MLSYIREGIQGWIAWAIVGLLIIPFALWGINQYFDTGGSLVVATVDGTEISQQRFQREFYSQRDRMRQMLGNQFSADLLDAQLKQKTLDDLINQEVLFQKATDAGFSVSNESIIGIIQSIEAFQEDGQFSNTLYKQQLSANGETPVMFEQRIQRGILTQQLYSGITTTPVVTRYDVDYLLKLQEQTRHIRYATLSVDAYKQEADASDTAIKQYYESNANRYMTQEQVSVSYLELNVSGLGKDAVPTEEDLHKLYDDRSSMYVVPEERRTRHILVAVDEGGSEDDIAAAKAKATDLRKQIADGADFKMLAEQYSDDPGSATLGGDLGYFGKGSLDPSYEETMFALAEGEVSEPVLSSFGYHIIKLEAVRAQKVKPFEEVKQTLIAEYQQGIADRKFFELSEKLTNLAYEVPDSLEDAAGASGLSIQTSELFGRNGGSGIAANPKVALAAFSDDVLKNGYNSEPIEIGENHMIVLRIKDHQAAKLRPLEEVKDEIAIQVIDEKARERVEKAGIDRLQQLRNGNSNVAEIARVEAVNDEQNASTSHQAEEVEVNNDNAEEHQGKGKGAELALAWQDAGELTRTDRSIDSKIVQKAFKLSKSLDGKPVYGGVVLASGDYVVLAIDKVTDGDVAAIDEAKRLSAKRNLLNLIGETAFQNLLTSFKQNSNIVVQDDNI